MITGELDPERMGSGIQYGDASLRRLNRQQQQQQKRPDCPCWWWYGPSLLYWMMIKMRFMFFLPLLCHSLFKIYVIQLRSVLIIEWWPFFSHCEATWSSFEGLFLWTLLQPLVLLVKRIFVLFYVYSRLSHSNINWRNNGCFL